MRGMVLGGLAAAGVLAFAAPALAAGDALEVGPVSVGGYNVSVRMTDEARTDFVTVTMRKRRGASVQTHTYSLQRELTFEGPNDFSTGRVTGGLGSRGSVNFSFTALEPGRIDPVAEGCEGQAGLMREGVVRGRLRFRVDRRRFGTIVLRQAEAKLGRRARYGCVTPLAVRGPLLIADRRVGTRDHFLFANQDGQRAEVHVSLVQGSARHTIEVDVPRVLLTTRADLSRASLRSFGPFLSGRAAYRNGRLTGDLTAHFDWPGRVRFPRVEDASLSRG